MNKSMGRRARRVKGERIAREKMTKKKKKKTPQGGCFRPAERKKRKKKKKKRGVDDGTRDYGFPGDYLS